MKKLNSDTSSRKFGVKHLTIFARFAKVVACVCVCVCRREASFYGYTLKTLIRLVCGRTVLLPVAGAFMPLKRNENDGVRSSFLRAGFDPP